MVQPGRQTPTVGCKTYEQPCPGTVRSETTIPLLTTRQEDSETALFTCIVPREQCPGIDPPRQKSGDSKGISWLSAGMPEDTLFRKSTWFQTILPSGQICSFRIPVPLVNIFIIPGAPCSGCMTAVYTFGRCTVRPSACVSLGRGECVRGTHVSLKLEMRTPLPFDRLDLLGISTSSQCKGWFLFRISQNFGRYLKLPKWP